MEEKTSYITDFLFATPTFLTGMGSAINLSGNYYTFNISQTPQEADRKALANDFNMIGQDLASVISRNRENPELAECGQ